MKSGRLKKDKEILEEDVVHKSKELANYTMLLVVILSVKFGFISPSAYLDGEI